MKIYSDQEIQAVLTKTPSGILDVAFASKTAEKVDEVTTAHKITEEQKPEVAEEVLYRLLSLTTQEEFQARLRERLTLPPDETTKLAEELSKEILHEVSEKNTMPYKQRESQENTRVEPGILPKNEQEEYKQLHLRPEGLTKAEAVPRPNSSSETTFGARPITRDELMHALTPKQTMQNDTDQVTNGTEQKQDEIGQPPIPRYSKPLTRTGESQ